jgi:phage/plasmid-associated DNA primase
MEDNLLDSNVTSKANKGSVAKNSKPGNVKKTGNKKYCATSMEAHVSAFLERHRVRKGGSGEGKQPFTHTTLQPGGCYYIGEDYIHHFMIHYCNAVKKGNKFTLTEKPEKYGPLRVDIDLKATLDQGLERQYTPDMVKTVIGMYQDELHKAMDAEDMSEEEAHKKLICVLLEKKSPRVDEGVVKDGIHLHFPFFGCEGWFQDEYLRTKVSERMAAVNVWKGCVYLPGQKYIDDNMAKKNWLMYGSAKKMDIEPFMLSKIYDHNLREITPEIAFADEMVDKKLSVSYYFPLFLSVRGYHETVPLKQDIEVKRPSKKRKGVVHKRRSEEDVLADLKLIKDAQFMEMLSDDRADSYDDWMRVGWALFNIGQGCEEALDIWLEFSRRSPKFVDGECQEKWSTMKMGDLSIGSLKHWAKLDNPDRYKEWKETDLTCQVDNSLCDKPNEWDMAKVVHCMFNDRFKCADAKRDIWYEYSTHRWQTMDDGIPLRLMLVDRVIGEYRKMKDWIKSHTLLKDREEAEKKEKRCNEIISSLKTCAFQDKVIKMCRILFHDKNFMKKLDENKTLFGCENGVLDLESNTFRDGMPDDYISYSCGLLYPKDMSSNDEELSELNIFFSKVFTNESVRNYFLDNVAFSMEGGNVNKTFCIGTGDGDNAKTVTYSLLEMAFGEYCIKFPRELFIVGKGNTSSGPRPELSRVRGKRLGIVQEIAKTETLNIGVLKELTGNDSFFARGLFEKGTDIKPMFTCFSQMNEPPKVPGHDEATWNRIRIVDFDSKFVKPKDVDKWPVPDTSQDQIKNKRFHADITFSKRLPELAPALLWHLVERRKTLKTTGLYEPTEVKSSTGRYRTQNDVFLQFTTERLAKPQVEKGKKQPFLKFSELYTEFQAWYVENHSSYAKERFNRITLLHEFSKRFGQATVQGKNEKGWFGWALVQDDPTPEDQQQQLQSILEKK